MRKFLFSFFILCMGTVSAQNINTPENFPDANFKRDVERFIGVDSGSPFTAEEAASATGILTLVRNAVDTTGIEFFTGITGLLTSRSNIQNLDVSQNVNLILLQCSGQSLTELDLRQNHALSILDCSDNQLQSLLLPADSRLFDIRCSNNQLSSLQIHDAVHLEILDCSGNQITVLDFQNTPSLFYVNATGNHLQDVSAFLTIPSLHSLDITRNRIGCDQVDNVVLLFNKLGAVKMAQINEELTTVQGLHAFEQTIEHACFLFTQPEFFTIKTESGQENYFLLDESGNTIVKGMLYFPPNYSAESEPVPLLIFNQGSGEIGPNLLSLDDNGIPQMLREGDQLPFVVFSPQYQPGTDFDELLYVGYDKAIADIVSTYNIDTDRLYVSGLSLGGLLTWMFPLTSEWKTAAMLPIAGGFLSINITPFDHNLLTQMPIWSFHGTRDQAVPVEDHIFAVELAQSLGGNARLSLVQNAEHAASWRQTYDDPVVYSWLLQHQRSQQVNASIQNWSFYR